MIKLEEAQRAELVSFLRQDAEINLFLLGDLETFGFDDTIQQYYGFYQADVLVGVAFAYRQEALHLYFAAVNETIITDVLKLADSAPFTYLMVGPQTYAYFESAFKDKIMEEKATMLSAYHPKDKAIAGLDLVEKLTFSDAEAIVALENKAFGKHEAVEKIRQELRAGDRTTYGLRVDDQLVSVATAVAYTQDNAMIIGVCTDEAYRQRGYANAVVRTLSDELLKEGRRALLFYDNPAAQSIYESLGYVPYSTYYMNTLKSKS